MIIPARNEERNLPTLIERLFSALRAIGRSFEAIAVNDCFSGINKTSAHRNNCLGLADLTAALNSLDTCCSSRPWAPFAEVPAAALVFGAKVGPTSHVLGESTSYGAADKGCQVYRAAGAQREVDYCTEFTGWLGGYLSGINAISLCPGGAGRCVCLRLRLTTQ